jgi:hypothetical protein
MNNLDFFLDPDRRQGGRKSVLLVLKIVIFHFLIETTSREKPTSFLTYLVFLDSMT